MRRIIIFGALAFGMTSILAEPVITRAAAKQRATVSATGKTFDEATKQAKELATKLAPNYSIFRLTSSGKEPNVTVTLIIEY